MALVSGLFTVGVIALVYWNYPFDGMVIEESWHWYQADPTESQASMGFTDLLLWFFTRRGGYHVTHLLILALGGTPTFINASVIGVQLLNLFLFAVIVCKLAGPFRLVPVLMVAVLYPFASGAHFWQILLIHHLAVMFFLAAMLCFLALTGPREVSTRRVMFYGLPGLACFWLSLSLMEHATLMPVLFVFLALYANNSRFGLLTVSRWRSPSVAVACCYLLLSLTFIWLMLHQGHPRLNFLSSTHAARFQEWAAAAHLPSSVIAGLAVGANAALFFTSAFIANSLGYLGYPLQAVTDHASLLMTEAKLWAGGASLVAMLGLYGLWVARGRTKDGAERVDASTSFLVAVGLLWAFLAYLPMSSSFAYPRVVGQVADRVNMLALFGVALSVGGVLDYAAKTMLRGARVRVALFYTGCFLGINVLLLNLYLQREYWIEAYHKERDVVVHVLNDLNQQHRNGQKPIVLIDRVHKADSLRVKLVRALQESDPLMRLSEVAKVVLARHFTEAGELEITRFHLRGVPLFGGSWDGADRVFNNYASQLTLDSVPVYKMEPGVELKQGAEQLIVEYNQKTVASYSMPEHQPIVVSLDESYFQFRGAATYRVQPFVAFIENREGRPVGHL